MLGLLHNLPQATIAADVEDHERFLEEYPNMLVVPLTRDEGLAHRSFAETIGPSTHNGADATCWALAHHVTSVSVRRLHPTEPQVTAEQLFSIRHRIVIAVAMA